MRNRIGGITCSLVLMAGAAPSAVLAQTPASQTPLQAVRSIAARWAYIEYKLPAKQRAAMLTKLAKRAEALASKHPKMAEPLIWEGVVLASQAGATGGIGALFTINHARSVLMESIKIDDRALNGSAYTTLATLYARAPGWPLSFGDRKKARTYFLKALKINPRGIDPNYFYGAFLAKNGQKQTAMRYLNTALQAPPRPGRSVADQGRRKQVKALVARLN